MKKKIHYGDLVIESGKKSIMKNLTEVSGSVYVRQGATFTAPNLTKSGCVYVHQGATFKTRLLKNLNYISVDNSLFVIESSKTTKGIKFYSGFIVLRITDGKLVKESCFVASKEGFTAHGETLKKAISDLQYKIVAEKLKHDPITKDTMITIEYYHIVTGSCDSGIKSWARNNGLSELHEIKASELLPILEKSDAYGLSKFRNLINF